MDGWMDENWDGWPIETPRISGRWYYERKNGLVQGFPDYFVWSQKIIFMK